MEEKEEIYIDLPWDVIDDCNGFGLDFGGSVLKVLYMHKDDWIEKEKRTKATGRLRLVNFSRDDFEKALLHLKERVSIQRKTPDEKPHIYTTGIGGSQYATKIRDTFNIKTSNITELECFFAAFNFLVKHSAASEIIHPIDKDTLQIAVKNAKQASDFATMVHEDSKNLAEEYKNTLKISDFKFPQQTPIESGKKFTDLPDLYPCFLVMCGSNGGIFIVNEDGSYGFANDLMRVGRVMLGLGSVLTGCKSYEELMSMAARGNMHAVHEFPQDLSHGVDLSENKNFYGAVVESAKGVDNPGTGFLFGKCVFRDRNEFKSEDLAMSLVHTLVTDFVQCTHLPLHLHPKVRHVFFAGGYPNHPLMRKAILKEWIFREVWDKGIRGGEKEPTNTHFLKHGAHLGALGALLNQKLQFRVVDESA